MSKHTRREFLGKTVFGAVGAGMALSAFRPEALLAEPQIAANHRGYAGGKFAIVLDGVTAGWVQSVEGGHATSDVVIEKMGSDNLQRKHIGNLKYEDIMLICGTGMSKGFYDWIKSSFDRQFLRKNGAIITTDYDYKEVSRLEWTSALITEVGFPALDAASKDEAKMTIKITPETTRFETKSGSKLVAPDQKMQKKWLPANFRLKIDGLDCTQVNKIEALTLKQKVVENPVGEARDYQKGPASQQVPNLVITLPESHAKAFYDWHESFVIKGNTGQGQKSGQLDYLTPNLQEVLFTLSFTNLGIFKLTPEKVEAGGESIRRVKAEMYCENMKFNYTSAAGA